MEQFLRSSGSSSPISLQKIGQAFTSVAEALLEGGAELLSGDGSGHAQQ